MESQHNSWLTFFFGAAFFFVAFFFGACGWCGGGWAVSSQPAWRGVARGGSKNGWRDAKRKKPALTFLAAFFFGAAFFFFGAFFFLGAWWCDVGRCL